MKGPRLRSPSAKEWDNWPEDYSGGWKGCQVGNYDTATNLRNLWTSPGVSDDFGHDLCQRPKGHKGYHYTATGLVCPPRRRKLSEHTT